MLAKRLDKLETELQLLITSHDLLLQYDTNATFDAVADPQLLRDHHFYDDAPERDPCSYNSKEKADHKKIDGGKTVERSPNAGQAGHVDEIEKGIRDDRTQSLEKENISLQDEIKIEKARRAEVEESAKHVYIQLQKVKDDLQREKQMKESLLVESHHLKTVVGDCHTKIDKLTSDFNESKAEIQLLESKVQRFSTEKANIIQRLLYLCNDLGFDMNHVKCGFLQTDDYTSYFDFLKSQFQQLQKQCNHDNEVERIRKLSSQLNTLVGRFANVEKERDSIKSNLAQCQHREDQLKNQLHLCQMSVTAAESELLKKQIEYECIIQKLQSESQLEKDKFSLKISEYSSVIKKSKELMLSLRNERDQSHKQLKEILDSKHWLEVQIKTMTTERQNLLFETEKIRKKVFEMKQEKLETTENWQIQKLNMEMNIRKYYTERKKCMELLNDMKHQILDLKSKREHDTSLFNVEKEKLAAENKRLDENLRVIKKISDDQGQTVTKLRSEIEDLKNCNFRLDSQVRDYASTENQLIRKIEQSDKQIEHYKRHIDELEEKIHRYVEDLRNHDCDDYVDSKYKRKADEIQHTLNEKMKQWQDAFEEIKRENDHAKSSSRHIIQQMEDMKSAHEKMISELKSKFQAEITRAKDLYIKQANEKVTKIRGLQAELDRTRHSSSQIQKALSTKIKQLQAALGICLGGSNPNAQQHSNSTLSFGSQIRHQNPPASSAFSDNVTGTHNGCCARNSANANSDQTHDHSCFSTSQNNVNDCILSGAFCAETCMGTNIPETFPPTDPLSEMFYILNS